jgi:tRNA(adenine34) deaminase
MERHTDDAVDTGMMQRCLALSKTSSQSGEFPYAAVICRDGAVVCESINRAVRDRDATRHAEVAALSEAQKVLGRTSLDDCTIYVNVEPCAFCCYAIRETRIRRVVYGLQSPVMGGHSRWDILGDTRLSDAMPEVFAPPPEVTAGLMEAEAEEVFKTWHPLIWAFVARRRLFVRHPPGMSGRRTHAARRGPQEALMTAFRWLVDWIGRR